MSVQSTECGRKSLGGAIRNMYESLIENTDTERSLLRESNGRIPRSYGLGIAIHYFVKNHVAAKKRFFAPVYACDALYSGALLKYGCVQAQKNR